MLDNLYKRLDKTLHFPIFPFYVENMSVNKFKTMEIALRQWNQN